MFEQTEEDPRILRMREILGIEPNQDAHDECDIEDECCDEEHSHAETSIKIKFGKSFTDKNGNAYEVGKTYEMKLPNEFHCDCTDEDAVWDPDCMDEVERYVRWYFQDTLLGKDSDKKLVYVFAHSDDALFDEDTTYADVEEEYDDDEEDPWDGLAGSSMKALKKCGTVYRGRIVDHSKNAKLTAEHCEDMNIDMCIPFYVLNICNAISAFC